jgi:hypothetical protein
MQLGGPGFFSLAPRFIDSWWMDFLYLMGYIFVPDFYQSAFSFSK